MWKWLFLVNGTMINHPPSILLRSPPELGSIPILFCKGADSAMLSNEQDNASLLLKSHLGEFASEGLRTLVLGLRILSEDECTDLLKKIHDASTNVTDVTTF